MKKAACLGEKGKDAAITSFHVFPAVAAFLTDGLETRMRSSSVSSPSSACRQCSTDQSSTHTTILLRRRAQEEEGDTPTAHSLALQSLCANWTFPVRPAKSKQSAAERESREMTAAVFCLRDTAQNCGMPGHCSISGTVPQDLGWLGAMLKKWPGGSDSARRPCV